MSDHTCSTHWQRQAGEAFADRRYHRRHDWLFDGGARVPGSSAPSSVPLPYSDPAAVDPEEALVAALSSCHLLWFLDLAARAGWVVDDYRDDAIGQLGRDERGHMAITQVTLRPQVRFGGDHQPTAEQHAELHQQAHAHCYIAHSVRATVLCEPALVG